MPLSAEHFWAALATGDLCPPATRDALRRDAAERGLGAEDCAARLVAEGVLTAYQARRLCEEDGPRLVLGDYVILDELGGGGMGRVYKAVHRRMDRVVALKLMSPDRVASPAALKRFHREVRAAARLIHPNIVTAFDAGEQDGTHYLVMEYVEGQDLATVVRENGVLPVVDALDCVLHVARGLQFAHAKGVIHRDIKPGNLLLDWSGHVRVLDMGLAALDRSLAQTAGERERTETPDEPHEPGELTQHGQILGTLDYMAPEQADRARHLDGRVDIYALGCTLFYLLIGRGPYAGDTAEAKLRAHREAAIPSLTALRPDVPAEVDLLFCRMVAKRPDQRPATVGKLIGDLEECLAAARARLAVPAEAGSAAGYAGGGDAFPAEDFAGDFQPGVAGGQVEPPVEEPSTVGEGLGVTEEITVSPAATVEVAASASPTALPPAEATALVSPCAAEPPRDAAPVDGAAVAPVVAATLGDAPRREDQSPLSPWLWAGLAVLALAAAMAASLLTR